MKVKLTIIAALAAFSLLAQDPAKVPANVKTGSTSTLVHHEAVPAPSLNTSRIWRLATKAQALRVQADATEAAKAAKDAEAELQTEQAALSAKCADAGLVLGYDENRNSSTYQDIVCVQKPKEQAAISATTPAKEK